MIIIIIIIIHILNKVVATQNTTVAFIQVFILGFG